MDSTSNPGGVEGDKLPHEPNPHSPTLKPIRQTVQHAGLLVGALLLIFGLAGVLVPQLAVFGVAFFAMIACAGLGALLAALGDQAKVTHPGVVLTGASAIAIAFYFVWYEGYQKIQELMYQAEVRVIGTKAEAMDGSQLVLSAENEPFIFIDAPMTINPAGAITYELRMPYQRAAQFREFGCSTIVIKDKNKNIITSFDFIPRTTMPADLSVVFQLIYDVAENKLLYTKNGSSREEATPCGKSAQTSAQKQTVEIIDSAKQEVTTPRPAAPQTKQKVAEEDKELPPLKPDVIGWTYFGTRNNVANTYTEKFYENQTHPKATMPSTNDILEAQTNVKMRNGPRTFNPSTGKYETPAELLTILPGKRIRVGGNPTVVKDIGVWVPVKEVLE